MLYETMRYPQKALDLSSPLPLGEEQSKEEQIDFFFKDLEHEREKTSGAGALKQCFAGRRWRQQNMFWPPHRRGNIQQVGFDLTTRLYL